MPTFNQGIRTNAGYDLFGKVQSGQTKIHYTKVVFSSLDLSNKSDDDIQSMTDVNPKELIIPNPQVLYKPKTNDSDQETEIRAVGSNETLKKGFYINTYALFAADDKGNEILYGVTADNNPSWLPAYDGIRPQALTYNWDTGDKDTDNVHFTDSHDAYATYGDLQDYKNNTSDDVSNLQQQITSNNNETNDMLKPNLSRITDYRLDNSSNNTVAISLYVKEGYSYWISFYVNEGYHIFMYNCNDFHHGLDYDGTRWNSQNPGTLMKYRIVPTKSEQIQLGFGTMNGTSLSVSNICITQSNEYIPFSIAELNSQRYTEYKTPYNLSPITNLFPPYYQSSFPVSIDMRDGKTYWFSCYVEEPMDHVEFRDDNGNPITNSQNHISDIQFGNEYTKGPKTNTIYGFCITPSSNVHCATIYINQYKESSQLTKICITQSKNYIPFEEAVQRNKYLASQYDLERLQDRLKDVESSVKTNLTSFNQTESDLNNKFDDLQNQINTNSNSQNDWKQLPNNTDIDKMYTPGNYCLFVGSHYGDSVNKLLTATSGLKIIHALYETYQILLSGNTEYIRNAYNNGPYSTWTKI